MSNAQRKTISLTFNLWALLILSVFLAVAPSRAFAHGGEDHGDEKPKTATTSAGVISRTARLGDFEIMLKHSPLEPDAAAAGKLFITKFATNEPADNANPAIEIESEKGSITLIPIEKTKAVGSYTVRIPALPEGSYTVRTKLTYSGETDTATFSGVEIAHQDAAAGTVNPWTQNSLMAMLFLVALLLFGGLAYFALRTIKSKPLGNKTVSA